MSDDPQEAVGRVTECERQIALADVVILNKLDLINDTARDKIRNKIQSINTSCDIQYTTYSRVDLDTILGIQAYSNANPPRFYFFNATNILTSFSCNYEDKNYGRGGCKSGAFCWNPDNSECNLFSRSKWFKLITINRQTDTISIWLTHTNLQYTGAQHNISYQYCHHDNGYCHEARRHWASFRDFVVGRPWFFLWRQVC